MSESILDIESELMQLFKKSDNSANAVNKKTKKTKKQSSSKTEKNEKDDVKLTKSVKKTNASSKEVEKKPTEDEREDVVKEKDKTLIVKPKSSQQKKPKKEAENKNIVKEEPKPLIEDDVVKNESNQLSSKPSEKNDLSKLVEGLAEINFQELFISNYRVIKNFKIVRKGIEKFLENKSLFKFDEVKRASDKLVTFGQKGGYLFDLKSILELYFILSIKDKDNAVRFTTRTSYEKPVGYDVCIAEMENVESYSLTDSPMLEFKGPALVTYFKQHLKQITFEQSLFKRYMQLCLTTKQSRLALNSAAKKLGFIKKEEKLNLSKLNSEETFHLVKTAGLIIFERLNHEQFKIVPNLTYFSKEEAVLFGFGKMQTLGSFSQTLISKDFLKDGKILPTEDF